MTPQIYKVQTEIEKRVFEDWINFGLAKGQKKLDEDSRGIDMDSDNSILRAQAHNEGYCATSNNARRRSKPRRSRGAGEAKPRRSRDESEARSVLRALSQVS